MSKFSVTLHAKKGNLFTTVFLKALFNKALIKYSFFVLKNGIFQLGLRSEDV